jgi:hypothetical protein
LAGRFAPGMSDEVVTVMGRQPTANRFFSKFQNLRLW